MATSSIALWVVYVSPQKCNARDFCAYVPRPGCFSFIISIESQNAAPIESNLSFRSQEHKALSITLKSKPNPLLSYYYDIIKFLQPVKKVIERGSYTHKIYVVALVGQNSIAPINPRELYSIM